jgi:ubiquitin carboxyl-terminal hydrolase 9/24
MLDPIRTCILSAEGAADDVMDDEESETEKQETDSNMETQGEEERSAKEQQMGVQRKDYNIGVLKHVQAIFAHLACSKLQYYVPKGFWRHFR